MDDDVINVSNLTDEELKQQMRRLDQLSSCPCSNCESRCWATGEITECRKYKKWYDRQHGINRRTYKRRNT